MLHWLQIYTCSKVTAFKCFLYFGHLKMIGEICYVNKLILNYDSFYVYECLAHMYVSRLVHAVPFGAQKRASNLLELELLIVVGSHVNAGNWFWVLSKSNQLLCRGIYLNFKRNCIKCMLILLKMVSFTSLLVASEIRVRFFWLNNVLLYICTILLSTNLCVGT